MECGRWPRAQAATPRRLILEPRQKHETDRDEGFWLEFPPRRVSAETRKSALQRCLDTIGQERKVPFLVLAQRDSSGDDRE